MTLDDLKDIPDKALVRFTGEARASRTGLGVYGLALGRHGEFLLCDANGRPSSLLNFLIAIEVLPEPVVEPTGAWATVLDRDGDPWFLETRLDSPIWRSFDGDLRDRAWSQLVEDFGPLTVVSKGVDQ